LSTKTKTTGREQAKNSSTGRLRQPDLTKRYKYKQPEIDLDSQQFRTTFIRPDRTPKNLLADGLIESLEWRSEGGDPVLQGTVTLHKEEDEPMLVHEGHVLRLDVFWQGKWVELWRMRLYDEQTTLAGSTTFALADDMRILQESVDYFHYTKTKHGGKPKGWLCHQVVRDIARRYHIPLGQVAAGKHHITDLSGEMSPMQAIQKAYAIERRGSGHRFVMRWQAGKLNILPMKRNPFLYVLKDAIRDATISKAERDEGFATAVTVRASVKKHGSRKHRTLVYQYVNKAAVKKEGFVHKVLNGSGVKDEQDARTKAKRYIAKHSVRQRTITGLQHQGIAFVRRGDAMWVSIPEYGFTGKQAIAFVSAGTWTLSGGSFTMSLDFSFDDPFKTAKSKRKDKDAKTRKDKEKK